MKKQITYWLSVIIIGVALGLTLQFVRAWTEPTEAPPGGNVGAPINTGSSTQDKTGWLVFQGGGTRYDTFLAVLGGNVGIGTASPSGKLDVRSASPVALKIQQGVTGDLAQFWSDVDGTGNQVVTITRDGNVGIGTASPTQKLDVAGGARTTALTSLSEGAYGSNNGICVGDCQYKIWSVSGAIYMNSSIGPTILQPNGGNVGIGTASPGAKLDVAGGVRPGNNSQVTTCNAATEGTMRYNTAKKIEFCDGNTWQAMGGRHFHLANVL